MVGKYIVHITFFPLIVYDQNSYAKVTLAITTSGHQSQALAQLPFIPTTVIVN